jgi:CRISPR/Cas system-associated endoribonuclease Cas2
MLVSPASSIQVLINVATINEIKKEKTMALKTRKQPRDLFDLWFIEQLQRSVWTCPAHNFSEMELKRELRKFLPKDYYKVINSLIYEKRTVDRKIKKDK